MDDSTRYTPYAPARGGRKGLLPKRTREEWDEALRLMAEDLAALGKHGAEGGKNENVEAAP